MSLERWVRVVREELALDGRRLGVQVLSRLLPRGSFNRSRTTMLRALGLSIEPTSLVAGGLTLTGSGSVRGLLTVGPGSYLTGPLHIDLEARVTIGARVYIGYDVMLVTVDHDVGEPSQRCGRRTFRPIVIEDGVWIGSRALVLPGVCIGRGSVVGAGAVVTRDVPPDVLVAGVPARIVRDLTEGERTVARGPRTGRGAPSPEEPQA